MKSVLDMIAMVLVLIGGLNWGLVGALNWGLVGAFGFNLVEAIFQVGSLVTQIVYILVGISAIYGAFVFFQE